MVNSKPIYTKPYFLIGIVTILGFFLRLRLCLNTSIWADEGQHIWIAGANNIWNMRGIYETAAHDQPFGMYPLLYGWKLIFGYTPASVRMFATVFSSISIASIGYAAFQLTKSTLTSFHAAMLMALSPFAIRYGYDVTPYAIVNAFAPFSIGWFVRDVERNSGKHSMALIAVNSWLLNLHYFSYFFVAAQCLYSFFLSIFHKSKDELKSLFVSTVIYSISSIPILLLYSPEIVNSNHQWIVSGTRSMISVLGSVVNYSYVLQIIAVIVFVASMIVGIFSWTDSSIRQSYSRLGITLILVMITIIFTCIPGLLGSKVLGHERYLMIIFPAVILFFALSIDLWRTQIQKGIVFAALAITFVCGVIFYQPTQNIQDFDSATTYIKKSSTSTSTILIPVCCQWPIYYYSQIKGMDVNLISILPEIFTKTKKMQDLLYTLAKKGSSNFFIIFYYTALDDQDTSIQKVVEAGFLLIERKEFEGVTVAQFSLPKFTSASR